MSRRVLPRRFLLSFSVALIGLLIIPAVNGLAITVQTGSYKIDLTGEKTWSVKFGIGDGASLSGVGYPKDSYSLSQSLKVKLDGQLGENFTVNADLDDSNPGYLQQFGVRMDTDNWDGLLGDSVSAGGDNFTVYNKKLLGLQLNGNLAGTGVEAVAGQLQGISETKVFYGNMAETEVEYTLYRTEAQLDETGYSKNILGLQYYGLDIEYVEGFTEPELVFSETGDFWGFLEDWEVGYLKDQIIQEPKKKLSSGQFKVVSADKDNLILLDERFNLLRNRIKDYISAYNEGLKEEEKKEYPFNPGTDYEKEFLNSLQTYVHLSVGDEELDLGDYERQRYYYLGRTGIDEENFSLEVRRNGGWESVEDLSGYSYELFPDKGLIELDFPGQFFDTGLADKGIRASFQYKISGKTYMLGFSVAPQSEKVYLNGNLLTRNTDYSIDYETGALILFQEVGPDDKIKVDFERARGGLGGFAQFGRSLYGFSTRMESDYGLVLDVSLFQARDSISGELSPEISTMPNVHTVGGLSGKYKENGWDVRFRFGGNLNRFPFDDNSRVKLPNGITRILSLAEAGYDIVLFGHKNGFTVRKSEDGNRIWESYGPEDGLAGDNVNDGLITEGMLFLATDTGLTRVELAGQAPFGRAPNWESYYESDGLPESEVLSLAGTADKLWLGTESGVVRAEKVIDPEETVTWEIITSDFFQDLPVTDMAHFNESLWLGTKSGLYRFDPETGELASEDPVLDAEINDLNVSDTSSGLYSATSKGIAKIGPDLSVDWLIEGETVSALSPAGGEVWYSLDNGFSRVGSTEQYGTKTITALLAAGETIWAGSEGYRVDDRRDLLLYRLEEELNSYSTSETKIDGSDDDRYGNINPANHTDRGIYLSAGASRKFDLWSRGLSLSTNFEYVQPTYTPIGKLDRNDHLKTEVALTTQISKNFSLDLNNSYSLTSLTDKKPGWAVTSGIALDWTSIVDTTAAFSWTAKRNGINDFGFNLGLAKDFWDGKLSSSIDLALNREIKAGGAISDFGTLAVSLSASPWKSTSLGIDYLYPGGFGSLERREQEKLNWNFNYSQELTLFPDYSAGFQLSGEGQARSLLVSGPGNWGNQLKLQFDPDEFMFGGIGLTPGLSLSWNTGNSGNEITGKLSSSTSFNALSLRTSLSRKIDMPSGSRLVKYQDKLQGNLRYEFPELTPVLDYSLSRNLLTHPVQGRKEKYTGDLTLGADWSPWPGVSNEVEAGVGYSSDEGLSYVLSDNLSWKISSKLTPEASLEMNYVPGSGKLGFSAKTDFSYPFRDRWGVSFTSGFNWGVKKSGEFYSSFFGSSGLRVEF